ncbi:MAG TPA: hypothetical protein V6D20_19200 [Candidatus Obscuribacterales bacterium]
MTSKGKAIAELLKGRSWLSVTTLRSLGRDQAAGWEGVFINEGDQCAGHFLQDGQRAKGLVTCIPSLLKVKSFHADVLVLDELPAIADFLLASGLSNKNGIRPLLIEELERRIRIEHETQLIDSVWGLFDGCSITAEAMAQTCDRVRSADVPHYLWVAERGRAYSRLSRSESVPGFLREFQRSSAALMKLTRHSLTTETVRQVDGLDWNNPHFLALADLQVQRNRGMRQLRICVEALLRHEGKQVHYCTPTVSDEQARQVRAQLKDIRQSLEVKRAIALENTPCPTELEAEALMRQEAIAPGDTLKLERYFIEKFYQVSVDRELVLWDRQGQRRTQIRRLERLLDGHKANVHSVQSIQTNPTTPQDWDLTQLQRFIFEKSGALAFVFQIWHGDLHELTEALIQPIAQFLKHHSRDVKLAFNFSRIDQVSDRQAVFLLLDWCGIQRRSQRGRVNGRAIRRYFVDTDHLNQIKTILHQRGVGDPPVSDRDLNQGDGSSQTAGLAQASWDDASLQDIKQMWESATTPEEREAIHQAFPDVVIQRAIA